MAENIADFEFLNKWKWCIGDTGYAQRSQYRKIRVGKYACKVIKMHRIINGTPKGFLTDHINRNKLDNQRKNLRTANKSINTLNRDAPQNNKSGRKGVHFEKWSKKWRAGIGINGKQIKSRRFANIQDAIKTRILIEKKYAL